MNSEEFIQCAKDIVYNYAIKHLDEIDDIPEFTEVYVVWNAFILGNQKALLSTNLPDGMYYEITYNGNKKEIYFDAYKKFENKCLKGEK